jgi:hypothetical protein
VPVARTPLTEEVPRLVVVTVAPFDLVVVEGKVGVVVLVDVDEEGGAFGILIFLAIMVEESSS